jgi:acetyl-CoA acetyltransferase
MARVVGMKAGLPKEVPANTVNRLCGTEMQAIISATQAVQTGEAQVALAGGAESMSRGPYWMPGARWGARMGETELVDPVMGALTDPFESILMGGTAENLAERGSISRERQDAFAVRSHQRAAAARAVVLMSSARAAELGAPVRAQVLAYASCGVDPSIMGIGPVIDDLGLDEEIVNPQRRGDRPRPSDRRHRRGDHRQDPRRDGAPRSGDRTRDAVHRRWPGDRHAAGARMTGRGVSGAR